METSQNGIELIKKFEGCKLVSYRDSTGIWTIGYGHTSGVTSGMAITRQQAEDYLKLDLKYFERKVTKFNYEWNQNQFDALVSFAYNIGSIDGLTAKGTRTIEEISNKISAYNKAGGKVLQGLVNRRAAEKELFDREIPNACIYYPQYTGNASLVGALASIGVDYSYSHRKQIAIANGITNYKGSYEQNIYLLSLLKEGKLQVG